MSTEIQYRPFPQKPELLVALREKGKPNKFVLRNTNEAVVAQLEWSGILQRRSATGSWAGGKITFKHPHWWSAKLNYQVAGDTELGSLPFEWRRLTYAVDWGHERFRLKTKGWFLRHFQLFDAQDELLADFRIREKFISFKIEISLEKRLYKHKNPEALLLTGLYLLFTRLQHAKSAG
jgi:hypothetical protein